MVVADKLCYGAKTDGGVSSLCCDVRRRGMIVEVVIYRCVVIMCGSREMLMYDVGYPHFRIINT